MDKPENTQQGDSWQNKAKIVTQENRNEVEDAFWDENFRSSVESDTNADQIENKELNGRCQWEIGNRER